MTNDPQPFATPSGLRRLTERLPSVSTGRSVVVATSAGRIRGRREPGLTSFTGVPFALPPTGDRRFRPPEPHTGWPGIHDATAPGPEAPQQSHAARFPQGRRRADASEDCLLLNVHTPAADDGRRPVMVWIHGGAFVDGSNSRVPFDPSRMVMCDDVVVVSINYRLGALGWLYLGHLDDRFADSGNLGLLDQTAALRWVSENVAAFGGDPDNVTVFGTSAGAMSIAALLATPATSGLFHRAICQSGAGAFPLSTDVAASVTDRLLSRLRVRTIDELVDTLPERLVHIQPTLTNDLTTELEVLHRLDVNLLLGPVLDGRTLTRPPHDAIADGSAADVALIVGTNDREYSWFTASIPPEERKLELALDRWFGDRAADVRDVYRRSVGDDERLIYEALQTDRVFRMPALRLAEAHQRGSTAPCYQYLLTWNPPRRFFGATHGLDVPIVFDVKDEQALTADNFPKGSHLPAELGLAMRAAWTSMARSGDPNHPDLPTWEPAGPNRATMVFDTPSRSVDAPQDDRRAAWDGLL